MTENPAARLSPRDRSLLEALREHALLCGGPADLPGRIDVKLAHALDLDGVPNRHIWAQIGSLVTCNIQTERPVLRLVLSEALVQAPGDVPVTRPIGLTLLGVPAGAVIVTDTPASPIRIEAVVTAQPRACDGDPSP